MLDIGKFDRKVVIQEATKTVDAMGGYIYEWSDSFLEWAHVEWKSGGSGDDQDKLQTTMSVEFTIRNVSSRQQKVTANNFRVQMPADASGVQKGIAQNYTVTGVLIWGGREKYKTLITELNTNENATR